MKLITVVDPHMNNTGPRSRRDKLFQSQQAKWEEIRALCEHGVDGLIVTGDWFHPKEGHRVHYAVVNWMIEFFRKFPCPVYGAMGNHDIMATPTNWRNQPIGALVKAEAFIPLWEDPSEENPIGLGLKLLHTDRFSSSGGLSVQITGNLYSYDYDKRPELYYAVPRMPDVDFVIHVPHGSLVPGNLNPPWEHTTPMRLASVVSEASRADLYVAGHEHDDLGVYAGPGFKCLNFGSLTRGSIQEYNLTRQVKVGVIEILGGNGGKGETIAVKLSEHVLLSAKPASEVFYTEELRKEKLKNEEIALFASMLRDRFSSQFKVTDPMDMLEVVFQSEAVSTEERDRTLKYVSEARAELGE